MDSGVPETEENRDFAEISYHGKAGKLRAEKRPGQELAGFSASLWRGGFSPGNTGLRGENILPAQEKNAILLPCTLQTQTNPLKPAAPPGRMTAEIHRKGLTL